MRQPALVVPVLSVLALLLTPDLLAGEEAWWPAGVTASLERAGARRGDWEDALRHVPEAHRTGLAFLLEHMPDGDLATLEPDFILENVALAYAARDAVPWGARIPEAVFLNDVLPYANISEPRDPWRAEFMTRFLPLVKDCTTPAEAAHRLNQRVFPELGVKYSTQRKRADQSPQESIDIGMASCTGLSIVLADACRAVGVPARLAGIPNWSDKRGNHTWVEVWDDDGTWHFAGAAEPDAKGLDHAWFVGDAQRAQRDVAEHAIYALSYRRTGLDFPMVFDESADPVSAVNVTDRYAKASDADAARTTRLMVRVTDADGKRVASRVTVRNPDDPTATFSGVSRDESFDLNDLLTFDVARGAKYEVEIKDGDTVARAMVTADAADRIVNVSIGGGRVNVTSSRSSGRAANALAGWFANPETEIPAALDMLVATQPERARAMAWEAYQASDHAAIKADFDANRVRDQTHESPYVARQVGARPKTGWPLVIAMHGGGGTTQEVNDQQWRHMQVYYKDQPDAGGYIYLALRAPNNSWNGFYADYVYPLVTNLIRQHLLFAEVDPDRVYLIGYSHGGYGAFSIGPKIPHRFAAIHASAAAPTDGDSVPRGLRTTPFTYMVGENDNAYGRRERCLKFDEAVQALRGERTDIYPVVLEYQEGYGHGGLPDRDKIRELLPHVRNAHPRELSWQMTDSVVKDHFWVSVPEAARGRIIEARCEGNRITVDVTDVPSLTLHLDERLVDPKKPIDIVIAGETIRCEPVPSMRVLCESLVDRGDPQLSSTMRVDVDCDSREVRCSAP